MYDESKASNLNADPEYILPLLLVAVLGGLESPFLGAATMAILSNPDLNHQSVLHASPAPNPILNICTARESCP